MDTAKAVKFDLLPADYWAMSRHASARKSIARWGAWFVGSGVFIIIGVVAPRLGLDVLAFGAGLVAGCLLTIAWWLLVMLRLQPQPGGAWLCQYDVQLTDGGVHVQTARWTCDLPWHGVLSVEETASHCFFRIDSVMMYTIPKRAFTNDEAVQHFIDFAHECVSRSRKTSNLGP